MRAFLMAAGLLTFLVAPARADSCGDLIDRVVAGTQATLINRSVDFAELSAPGGMTMTLACGDPSAVGVQFKGEAPPPGYFTLFGQAGHAIAGIESGVIEGAAHRAQEKAVTTRHSHVDAGHALVTCSVSGSVTGCAMIGKAERD